MVSDRSNGIYRSILTAAFGIGLLAASNPPTYDAHVAQGGQQAQRPPSTSATPPKAAEPPYRPYPDAKADSCYKARDHDSADLCAQWRAALAAEKSASEAKRATNWAIFATVLSVLGVGGLILTIWQTHGALGEARRGNRLSMKANARATRQALAGTKETEAALAVASRNAEATAALVAVSEKTASMQLRAYLAVQKIEPIEMPELSFFAVKVHVSNDGQTPAKITSVNRAYYIGPFPQIDPRQQGPAQTPHIHFPPILNPKCSDIILTAGLDGADYETFRHSGDDKALYIYGRVEYADSFLHPHWLDYCYRLCWGTRNLPEGCTVCMAGNGTD